MCFFHLLLALSQFVCNITLALILDSTSSNDEWIRMLFTEHGGVLMRMDFGLEKVKMCCLKSQGWKETNK